MDAVTCKIFLGPSEVNAPAFTVGDVFDLHCQGDLGKNDASAYAILMPKEQKYSLKALAGARWDGDTLILPATTYTVGKMQIKDAKLAVTDRVWAMAPLDFTVNSVIEKKNPQEKQEPYGPIGPITMSWPTSWWIALALFIALLVSAIGGIVYAVRKRKAFAAELVKLRVGGDPAAEFYSHMRRLKREHRVFISEGAVRPEEATVIVKQIDDVLRLYLMRRFEIPAREWKSRKIAARVFPGEKQKDAAEKLQALFFELNAVIHPAKDRAELSAKDLIQLAETSQTLVELGEKRTQKGGRRGMA